MVKILVVDDDSRCLESCRDLLAAEGFEVETAADGSAAMTKGRNFHPDILILDWAMGMPPAGLTLAAALRAECPNVQIIVISGHLLADMDPQLQALSVVGFLAKPFRADELLASIAAAKQRMERRDGR